MHDGRSRLDLCLSAIAEQKRLALALAAKFLFSQNVAGNTG